MIWIYRIFYIPIFFIMFPYYLWRMLRRGGYREDFHYRFGFIKPLWVKEGHIKRVWIHAVSLGEVNAIRPLVEKLLAGGGVEIFLTATTSTSYKVARELYSDKVMRVSLFPFDFWVFSWVTWNRVDPDLVLLMEGELWPEHIHQGGARGVPILLMNGRLSDRSFRRYMKVKWLAKSLILKKLSWLLAGGEQDLRRFIEIGMDESKAECTGNLKLDVMPKKVLTDNEKEELKVEMGFRGGGRPLILVGSSTWSGEEALLIKILEKALGMGIDCRLLLVPRHAERREEIRELLKAQKRSWHMRSSGKRAPDGTYIYLADTTGELSILSQVADLVFIGKSLLPHNGGQTPIEGAALGLAMVYGPMMTNFKDVSGALEGVGATVRCRDAEELEGVIIGLLGDGGRRKAMGEAARRWHGFNRGATDKTVDVIRHFIR